ncbi:MAG: hypothetical protein M3O34_13555 [Chloroflexota bacterium]|nr:hypothetical protein [Chloroflexota bacterium]
MTVDQSRAPGAAGEARGHRTDLAALRYEWQAVHGELSSVIEAILAQIFATASRQAVEALARLEREGADILDDLEARRAVAEAEMTELAARVEHLERRVGMAEEERRQAIEAAERATSELLARARRQADEIVGEAESRAAARHGEAEEAAAQRIADAEARAGEILEEARLRAEEIEREAAEAERLGPTQSTGIAEAVVVEDQLRGLAERINRLLQTTSEVAATEATHQHADGEATPPERAVVVPLRPRANEAPVGTTGDENFLGASSSEGGTSEHAASVADEPDLRPAPAAALERERVGSPAALRSEEAGREREGPLADEDVRWRDSAPSRPDGAVEPPRPIPAPTSRDVVPVNDEDSAAPPAQTLVFQGVPNFQVALALERALKGLPGVHGVRVADFDERQLTFQVTHELGSGLAHEVLALRSHELELVESGREPDEFVFRA